MRTGMIDELRYSARRTSGLTIRGIADLNAGAAARLRGTVLGDGALRFVARGCFGARSFGSRNHVGRAARQVFADEVLDENRQQLALTERRVRLMQRIVDGGKHLSLLFESVQSTGGHRTALEVHALVQFFQREILAFPGFDL